MDAGYAVFYVLEKDLDKEEEQKLFQYSNLNAGNVQGNGYKLLYNVLFIVYHQRLGQPEHLMHFGGLESNK